VSGVGVPIVKLNGKSSLTLRSNGNRFDLMGLFDFQKDIKLNSEGGFNRRELLKAGDVFARPAALTQHAHHLDLVMKD